MMLKRPSHKRTLRLCGLLCCVLLLAGGYWWWLQRPKTFTLRSRYLLDGVSSPFTAVLTQFCPTGVLIEQVHGGPALANEWFLPHCYTLLDWDGKQRWQVESSPFEPATRELRNNIAKNYCYSELHALSRDGHLLAVAHLNPRATLLTVRRWRDGRADGQVLIPCHTICQDYLAMHITESGRIWLCYADSPNCTLWCIDGTRVARGAHPNLFAGPTGCFLSMDGQTLVCAYANNRKYNTVQVTGSRVVVTPRAQRNSDVPLTEQGSWQSTVNAGESRLAVTPDKRYVLSFSSQVGKPAQIVEMLWKVLGRRDQLNSSYILLDERPNRMRALLRVHPQLNSQPFTPQDRLIYEQGIPYLIEAWGLTPDYPWGLSPDGHHLGLVVDHVKDYSNYDPVTDQRSLFLYKW